MHFSLHHHPSFSLIAAEGEVTSAAVGGVLDLFALVPMEQAVIVDLSRVERLEPGAAAALARELAPRAAITQVAAIVDDTTVAAPLVLEELHQWVPFVRTRDDAVALATGVVGVGR